MANLDETRLEGQDVGITESKSLRVSFPLNLPVGTRSPAVPVDEEAEVGVVEQKLAIETLDVDRPDILAPSDKVKRGVSLVEQRLPFSRF